ncbi:MAG: hypothetical protein H6621_08260 [Halobacteriovoraceae bacterium]|nr:hypothetical protein [Halobacteriovoraceae bacterium]
MKLSKLLIISFLISASNLFSMDVKSSSVNYECTFNQDETFSGSVALTEEFVTGQKSCMPFANKKHTFCFTLERKYKINRIFLVLRKEGYYSALDKELGVELFEGDEVVMKTAGYGMHSGQLICKFSQFI